MGKDIKKFVNLKFLKTIDLGLMRELIERHAAGPDGIDLSALDGDGPDARSKLTEYFKRPAGNWPEGLVADLHRISELGDADGLQLILQQAHRANVTLFAATDPDQDDPLPQSHEPKHVALRVYLHHPAVFEAAADFRALQAPPALAEFAGPERGVGADLTDARIEAFRARIAEIFRADLQGDYCRLGPYEDGDEINMVISHGATVSTMPVVDGGAERVISLRAVKYAVLRYSETTGALKLGGVPKARQSEIAELFAMTILERGGFFAGDDAQDLYTLEPVMRAGSGFTFDHAFNPNILQVLLTEAAADLYGEDEKGAWRLHRSLRSKDASGAALAHFTQTPVRFGRNWRLGEIVFRVFFKSEGKRPSQVTVRLKPRGTVAFRRTRYERQIMTLLERNQLVVERDDLRLIDAADWPPPRGARHAQTQSGLLLRRPVAGFYSAVDKQPWLHGRSTGDLTIRWTRRDRALASDSWEAVEVPMSEASEAYEVDILAGATVKRTLTVAAPSALYTAAQQTADWGATLGPGSSLDVRIAQLSARLGRGDTRTATLTF